MSETNNVDLLTKYQTLLVENERLKAENKRLRAQLGQVYPHPMGLFELKPNELCSGVTQNSDTREKVHLFMSLFKGREDVYAKRWQTKEGKSGYSPLCLNEWKSGVCGKPRIKCSQCENKDYGVLDEKVIEEHLRGNTIIGVYPMLPDETCCFLAIDFDGEGWQKDVFIVRDVCKEFNIPLAVERSRSGNGAHIWFFFQKPISAVLARKFGSSLLTYSMSKRHEITFKSYDRFFPNQDTMPKGGLGNLIAFPLQKSVRELGNSVFINEHLEAYVDQWAFLSGMKKLSENEVEGLARILWRGNELGPLKIDEEERAKPWEHYSIKLTQNDFPPKVGVVEADMLYIAKKGISQKALNALKRLAAFKNPEFYKAQAMRMPTYSKPRVISCSDETEEYLCLPRGCEEEVEGLLHNVQVDINWADKTNHGSDINVEFKGELREEQQLAVDLLLKYNHGVLAATTAFGKTVIGAKLIAERKVSTLILVHRQQLLTQWQDRLAEFLEIHDELPEFEPKRGRKKKRNIIGQIVAGKDNMGGIIDVAVMQSLNNGGDIKECVRNYGMVIIDECHHVPAFSFEQILKKVDARYIYGLTATPVRQDGHHPIIFMYCGPERFRVDAKKHAKERPFDHYVIPRFTSFKEVLETDSKMASIQELYSDMVDSAFRNQLIIDDVIKCHENGRNCLVLTERTAHVELLAQKLNERIPDVITLTGSMGTKKTKEMQARISEVPTDKPLTLVATGKYIGEGFDEPRLDTLFLATPISWKGTLQQYAGRLHRLYESKTEVQIYDYVDIHVKMLEKMYHKRLNGYASIGYKVKGESALAEATDIIFDKSNFWPVYSKDILNAAKEVFIVSPFMTKKRVMQTLQYLSSAISNQVKVQVMTRPIGDFKDKDKIALEYCVNVVRDVGVTLILKSNIHQKFTIIDQSIVWYGSINLLSFGNAEESMMRLGSPNIAYELLKSMDSFISCGKP